MQGEIQKVISLRGTLVENDYDGCGRGCLILKGGTPQLLIYSSKISDVSIRRIDTAEKADDKTEIYFGIVSCYEFCCEQKIYPLGGG